jgi:hypothetical protein
MSITWNEHPVSLDKPVLVVYLGGWIDSGGAAQLATDALLEECQAEPLAVFDDDTYLDFRARRPTMKLVEGRNTVLDWQHITLSHGRDRIGRDIIIAHGPEPDLAWHRFVKDLTDAAVNLGVSNCAHLGAYPFSCPHTRPSRLSMTTASEDVLATLPFLRSTLDVPGGIGSALEHSLHDADIPTLGIWAQVPHYAATMPYPAAAVALLDGLRDALDLVVDGTDLRSTMVEHRERLDNLVRDNSEHEQMLKQLEVAHDAQLADEPVIDAVPPTIGEISADELSEQVERFLRGHD